MKKMLMSLLMLATQCMPSAIAATASGNIIRVEGRADNNCRYVSLKTANGNLLMLRIASGAGAEGVMAVAMTALTLRQQVEVEYAAASICGG